MGVTVPTPATPHNKRRYYMSKVANSARKRKEKRRENGPKQNLKYCLVITQAAGSSVVEVNQAFSPPLGVSNAAKEFEIHKIGDIVYSITDIVDAVTGPVPFEPIPIVKPVEEVKDESVNDG